MTMYIKGVRNTFETDLREQGVSLLAFDENNREAGQKSNFKVGSRDTCFPLLREAL